MENWRHSDPNWLLGAGRKQKQPRHPVLTTNNLYSIYRAVAGGFGVAALPDYMASEVTGLTRVLPKYQSTTREACFIYPEALRHSRRIRVFRDFILEKIAEQQGAGKQRVGRERSKTASGKR